MINIESSLGDDETALLLSHATMEPGELLLPPSTTSTTDDKDELHVLTSKIEMLFDKPYASPTSVMLHHDAAALSSVPNVDLAEEEDEEDDEQEDAGEEHAGEEDAEEEGEAETALAGEDVPTASAAPSFSVDVSFAWSADGRATIDIFSKAWDEEGEDEDEDDEAHDGPPAPLRDDAWERLGQTTAMEDTMPPLLAPGAVEQGQGGPLDQQKKAKAPSSRLGALKMPLMEIVPAIPEIKTLKTKATAPAAAAPSAAEPSASKAPASSTRRGRKVPHAARPTAATLVAAVRRNASPAAQARVGLRSRGVTWHPDVPRARPKRAQTERPSGQIDLTETGHTARQLMSYASNAVINRSAPQRPAHMQKTCRGDARRDWLMEQIELTKEMTRSYGGAGGAHDEKRKNNGVQDEGQVAKDGSRMPFVPKARRTQRPPQMTAKRKQTITNPLAMRPKTA